MPAREAPHLLILGGTAEAARLASAAVARFGSGLTVTTSLAGTTRTPKPIAGEVRVGGFGGARGLATWLRAEQVDMVVDATHPFARNISENSFKATGAENCPVLVFSRPSWQPKPGDRWRVVSDLDSAAVLLPDMAKRAFLSVGSQRLSAFARLPSVHLVVRMIDPPAEPLSLMDHKVLLGRGPFDVDAERDLLQRERIDTVVSRNSGGAATYAKIEAARDLKIPVVMVEPPVREAGESVESLEGALRWIETQVAVRGGADS